MTRSWVVMAAMAALLGCGEDDRPLLNYVPGVYQGAKDQALSDDARKELAARVKTMGRL